MTNQRQRRRRPGVLGGAIAPALVVVVVVSVLLSPGAHGQGRKTSRQVTVFGIVAIPGDTTIDPKLALVAPQLRKVLPGHGFRLLDVKSKRLAAGQAVNCDLGGGAVAATTLMVPLDDNGKVQLRCDLLQDGIPQHATVVATPANQLFFLNKMHADGSRLLIGLGAR